MIDILGTRKENQAAGAILEEQLTQANHLSGIFYRGFPLIAGSEGILSLDGLLCSNEIGVVIFHYVDGRDLDQNLIDNIDEVYLRLRARLSEVKELNIERELAVPIISVVFAPTFLKNNSNDYLRLNVVKSLDEIKTLIMNSKWDNNHLFNTVLSRLQSLNNLKSKKKRQYVKQHSSKGYALQSLDKKLATLDTNQTRAVLEIVDGIQRIRGLAGSGKTIVLARKIAHIHAQNPDWKIAVTFNSRSLKVQFKKLIEMFYRDSSNEDVDWNKINIIHAWGSAQSPGIYYNACIAHNLPYYDFEASKSLKNRDEDNFQAVCKNFLEVRQVSKSLYDLILIDEAQDFSPEFLQLCYAILPDTKRLIYAYDELQNLGDASMLSPDEIWGQSESGKPIVSFKSKSQDIILDICYRNPGPILTAAHALGFGIYNNPIIQMFDFEGLWNEIGYETINGRLSEGSEVELERSAKSSPTLLETHNTINELIQFIKFDNTSEQAYWISQQIIKNLEEDELLPSDIVVIHPEAATMRKAVGLIRKYLFDHKINSSIAGITSSPDEFFSENAITFTSIYRAKGNEAAMVYVINADYCNTPTSLAKKRNILFTAMTRTKAWLRVCGTGDYFNGLKDEFETVKAHNFKLKFKYPTQAEREKMRIVNRDMTNKEKDRVKAAQANAKNLAALLENEVNIEDIPQDIRTKLIEKLMR